MGETSELISPIEPIGPIAVGNVTRTTNPRDRCTAARGRGRRTGAVDVDQPTNPPPEPGSGRRIVSVGGNLSPMQQAWSDYVGHGLKCPRCRSLDAGRCGDAERLHRDYREISDEAFERLADEEG